MNKVKTLLIVLVSALVFSACVGSESGPVVSQAESPTTSTSLTTSGMVTQDEIWSGEILITGDVEIPQGITVTVLPGTTVRFTAQSDDQHSPEEYDPEDESTLHMKLISILVMGKLDAQGTPDNFISFISDNQSPGEMDWESILLEGDGSVFLDYVLIEHSHLGVQLNSPTISLSVNHTKFQDIYTCAICGEGARPSLEQPVVILDSWFIRCGRECIDTYTDQNVVIRHNVFAENHVAIMSVGSAISIEGNLFINNERGIGVVEGGTPNIIGNVFTQTQAAAIFIVDASPMVANNNFFENVFNLQMEGSSQDVFAADNWWGSSNPEAIANSIFDGRDDPNLGIVHFEPYADQAFDLDIPEYE